MPTTVFITRPLPPDSPFRLRLEAAGCTVEGRSLVQFTPLPFETIPVADWIFFSSAQGVKFFFEQIKSIPAVKWAAIGKATAEALRKYTGAVDFIGSGDPAETASIFLQKIENQTVLFPGARNARQEIRRMIAAHAPVHTLDVYDNQPIPAPPASDARVLVFTSPLNAQAYFGKNTPVAGQIILAIGSSTAAALRALGIADIVQPPEPTETALADAVLASLDR